MKIKVSLEKFNYYSQLIFSCMNKEEQDDPHSQSALKYAFKKWQKTPLIQADKLTAEAKEDLQDKIEAIEVKYGLRDEKTGVLVKENNVVQYKAEDEVKASKEKRQVHKDVNKRLNDEEIEFEPFFFKDEKRIQTMDPFTREELYGVFIETPEGLKVAIPDAIDSLPHESIG